jgi:hypothetical protein
MTRGKTPSKINRTIGIYRRLFVINFTVNKAFMSAIILIGPAFPVRRGFTPRLAVAPTELDIYRGIFYPGFRYPGFRFASPRAGGGTSLRDSRTNSMFG